MSAPPIPPSALRDPAVFVATGFGIGLLRPAPGTWGSALGLLIAVGLVQLPLLAAVAVVAVAALAGVPLCTAAGRRLGVSDHGGIVWDEFVGVWVAVVALPPGIVTFVLAFLLFRLFDIAKPWPVSWADRALPRLVVELLRSGGL